MEFDKKQQELEMKTDEQQYNNTSRNDGSMHFENEHRSGGSQNQHELGKSGMIQMANLDVPTPTIRRMQRSVSQYSGSCAVTSED